MNPLGPLVAGWQEVRANPLRTLISMLGIVVGIAAITVIVAASIMAQVATREFIEREFGRPATLQLNFEAGPPSSTTRERLETLLDRFGVPFWTPLAQVEARWTDAGGQEEVFTVIGTGHQLSRIRYIPLLAGRWLNRGDDHRLGITMVANRALIRSMGFPSSGDAIGTQVTLATGSPTVARIVGVIENGQQELQEAAAYVQFRAIDRWHIGSAPGQTSYLMRIDPDDEGLLRELLHENSGVWSGPAPVLARIDEAGNYEAIIEQQRAVLSVVAGIALVIGGLGVLNIGLVTVRQRVREFGIRRSFGATGTAIFTTVLSESLVTTVIGGALGVAVGAGLTGALPGTVIGELPAGSLPSFPLRASLVGLAVAAMVGLLAGAVPALRATQAPVIDAIRE